jgi:flagellar M-ring protein FliF
VAPLIRASLSQPRRDASSSTTNFEISKTIEHIIRSPSDIKNISVAVVIDGLHKKVTRPDGTTLVEYVPRSEEELEKYRRMVLAAVGNPVARDVEVVNVPLSSSVAEMEREAAEATQMNKNRRFYATVGVIAAIIGLLLFIFFLIRYLLERGILRIAPAPRPEAEEEERIDLVTREEELEGVRDMLEQSPEDVVALLKAWMKEEE